jgi:hypothetical protein
VAAIRIARRRSFVVLHKWQQTMICHVARKARYRIAFRVCDGIGICEKKQGIALSDNFSRPDFLLATLPILPGCNEREHARWPRAQGCHFFHAVLRQRRFFMLDATRKSCSFNFSKAQFPGRQHG